MYCSISVMLLMLQLCQNFFLALGTLFFALSTCPPKCLQVPACMYVCMCIYIYLCQPQKEICIKKIYIYTYINLSLSLYIYIFVYIYIHTNLSQKYLLLDLWRYIFILYIFLIGVHIFNNIYIYFSIY